MTKTHTPEFKFVPYKKRLVFNCPYCGSKLLNQERIKCSCGAEFKLQVKEVHGPKENIVHD